MIHAEKTPNGVKFNCAGVADDILSEAAVAFAHLIVNAAKGSQIEGDAVDEVTVIKEIILRTKAYIEDIKDNCVAFGGGGASSGAKSDNSAPHPQQGSPIPPRKRRRRYRPS